MREQRRVQAAQERPEPGRLHPHELELSGDEAILRKEGERLILEPAPPRSLLEVLASLGPLDEELPPIPEPRTDSVDL